jgi:putative FmdB family regulatory protein
VPIYTYACSTCGQQLEKRQSFSDAPLTTCDDCGGALRKVIHPVGIVFKGSGFYVTDSRNGSKSETAGPKAESAAKGETTGDSASAPSGAPAATTPSSPAPSTESKAPAASSN